MKHIKTYNIFESHYEVSDVIDMILSDIEESEIDPGTIFISRCAFNVKKDGTPLKVGADFYLEEDSISLYDFRKFVNWVRFDVKKSARKYGKNQKYGIALTTTKYKEGAIRSGVAESAVIDIFNSLNKERFNSFGYDITIGKDIFKRPYVLIYR